MFVEALATWFIQKSCWILIYFATIMLWILFVNDSWWWWRRWWWGQHSFHRYDKCWRGNIFFKKWIDLLKGPHENRCVHIQAAHTCSHSRVKTISFVPRKCEINANRWINQKLNYVPIDHEGILETEWVESSASLISWGKLRLDKRKKKERKTYVN